MTPWQRWRRYTDLRKRSALMRGQWWPRVVVSAPWQGYSDLRAYRRAIRNHPSNGA